MSEHRRGKHSRGTNKTAENNWTGSHVEEHWASIPNRNPITTEI